jgi:hypothetical protein
MSALGAYWLWIDYINPPLAQNNTLLWDDRCALTASARHVPIIQQAFLEKA